MEAKTESGPLQENREIASRLRSSYGRYFSYFTSNSERSFANRTVVFPFCSVWIDFI